MMRTAGLVVGLASILSAAAAFSEDSSHLAFGSSNPGPWAARPISSCRYEFDARNLTAPRLALSRIGGGRQTTCPFIEGQSTPVVVFALESGETCPLEVESGLKATKATLLSQREFAAELVRCSPLFTPATSDAPGGAFLISARDSPSPLFGNTDSFAAHEVEINRLAASQGLPFGYIGGWANNDVHYFCIELMKGANIDPLEVLKSSSAWLARSGREMHIASGGCARASFSYRTAGPDLQVRQTKLDVHFLRSTVSPKGRDFQISVISQFARSGFKTKRLERQLIPGISADDYASYSFDLGGNGSGQGEILFSPLSFSLDLKSPTPALCAAMFGAMSATDSFASPVLDRPALLPIGIHGKPPPRRILTSVRWVRDGAELCDGLRAREDAEK
jgi:hypothetical protein